MLYRIHWIQIYLVFYFICCNQVYADVYCVNHEQSDTQVSTCKAMKKIRGESISAASVNLLNTTRPKITFNLTCLADDSICNGAYNTFEKAADIITKVFSLKSNIAINASFISFCKVMGDCIDNNEMITAGQATPTISYIMSDLSDNTTRMYPQALLKQFTRLSTTPQWDEYDITASFNTEMDWHFINDPNPITPNQTDFLRTVIHELIHGLGFVSSWGDNLYQSFSTLIDNLDHFITPALLASDNDNHILDGADTPQPFWGFVEYPLDKFIYYDTDHTNASQTLYPFTTITKRLNQWCNANALFRSSIDMANSWYNSDVFQHASRIYGRSIKGRDVMAVVNQTPVLYLETSLNPFSAGSSLSHVDHSQYIDSAEYLMVYTANRGVSVETLDKKYPTGPFGPELMKIMASLGYFIDGSFNVTTHQPQIDYWSPPDGLVKTDSNKDPSVTIDQDGPAHAPKNSSTSSLAATSSANYTSPAYRIEYQCYLHVAILTLLVILSH